MLFQWLEEDVGKDRLMTLWLLLMWTCWYWVWGTSPMWPGEIPMVSVLEPRGRVSSWEELESRGLLINKKMIFTRKKDLPATEVEPRFKALGWESASRVKSELSSHKTEGLQGHTAFKLGQVSLCKGNWKGWKAETAKANKQEQGVWQEPNWGCMSQRTEQEAGQVGMGKVSDEWLIGRRFWSRRSALRSSLFGSQGTDSRY